MFLMDEIRKTFLLWKKVYLSYWLVLMGKIMKEGNVLVFPVYNDYIYMHTNFPLLFKIWQYHVNNICLDN